jgi:hypothetical protein
MRGGRGHILWHDRTSLRETLTHRHAEKKHRFRYEFPLCMGELPQKCRGSHFRILHSTLMDVSAFKDIARGAVGKKLGVSYRMAQAASEPAEVIPEVEGFAIKGKRLCDVVVGDEPPKPEMEHLAAIFVVGEAWPFVRPTVCRTQKWSKLVAA